MRRRNPYGEPTFRKEAGFWLVHGLFGAKRPELAGKYQTKSEAMKAAKTLAREERETVHVSGPRGQHIEARVNPPGKTKFDRCVKAVTKRGGAYDPRAVCGAMRARGTLNPSNKILRGLSEADKDEVIRHSDRTLYRALEEGFDRKKASELFDMAATRKAQELRKARRNPADSSAKAYERFHGQKPTQYVKVTKRIHHHANLWSIGDLKKLKIKSVDGRSIVSLSSFKGTILAANEQAFADLTQEGRSRLTQLFIEGGDQSVDLRSFGIDPNDAHELETLGKATLIDYRTVKVHLGDEGGDAVYRHKFRTTREGDKHVTLRVAKYPDVIYRVLDKQLEFSGGSYEIRAEGIDR